MDIGITTYGVHIPRYRMDRKVIRCAMGWLNPMGLPGEKAVANYDEDSITMALEACRSCLEGNDADIGGVYFATTTQPYREGEGAAIIATALDLSQQIRTVDFGNSLKCGTSALLAAFESVKSESLENVIVCAADSRLGRPGSVGEMMFGDGAGAVIIGREGLIAALRGSCSVSYDFPDYRRLALDTYVHSVEDRFIREEGYGKFIPEVISGLFKKYGLNAEQFAKVAFPCLHVGQYSSIGKKLGFRTDQLQEPLLTALGEAGAASPFLLLAAMLEHAKAGDHVLLAGYGNGAEALWLTVTERIEEVKNHRKMARAIDKKIPLTGYEKYLAFRGMLPVDTGSVLTDAPLTQLPHVWRERRSILALRGTKCKRCGTPHYPSQNVCAQPECGAVNEMEDYTFSGRKAKLFSYTIDNISFTLNPPFLFGLVDFDGGGRFVFQLTDCEAKEVVTGMPLVMSLRKKYEDPAKGFEGYFWKAVPGE
ncbi:MAG: hydroxymethylglutaryl-CoA synthase family protein [Deltaproteobacteria bacterium]|nr:hydroxymethylglutaryl-CoA synthase family protein [Deltaproteobacteria bacterium]